MSGAEAFDVVTVGHLAIDTIFSPSITRPRNRLGGSPTYVSVTAAKLGAKVSLISKVGDDFSDEYLKWLQNNDVDLSGLKRVANTSTTRFVLEYGIWKRKLRLEARAPTISHTDIPNSLRAKIAHVAPIANEISRGVITKLRRSAEILSLDPQGFTRSFDKKGEVRLKRWKDFSALAQIDVFKSTIKEVQIITGAQDLRLAMQTIRGYGINIVLVTRGMRGATLLFDNRSYEIPAYKSRHVVDPTGAGDAFIGAFLAEHLRVKDASWSACVGSAAASFVVEGVGPERFGEKHEVYERAEGIYEKAVRTK